MREYTRDRHEYLYSQSGCYYISGRLGPASAYRTFESQIRVPPKPAPMTDHQASTSSNSPHGAASLPSLFRLGESKSEFCSSED